jgi:hypothetical protein
MRALLLVSLLAFPASLLAQDVVSSGTVLPVQLHGSLSSKKSKPGQVITARIMQNVPLAQGKTIHAGAKVVGHLLDVAPATSGAGAKITLRFDSLIISKRSIPITVSLRAMASRLEVDEAQIPNYGGDRGTPSSAYETVQVGGEIVYRGGGHVMEGETIVGEPVYDGVLGRLRANPEGNCRSTVDGNDRPQALWLFSSDACGTYGYPHVKITHAGRSKPFGEIVLTSAEGEVIIRAGSGILLRVISTPTAPPDAGV